MSLESSNKTFNFNKQDYEFLIRIYNGVNDVILNSVAWEDLFLEEDIFDWKIKGSILVKSDYETFERASNDAVKATGMNKSNLIYKFRNDCRDTIFITIKPTNPTQLQGLENNSNWQFRDKIWRMELEGVIYDVEDLPNEGVDRKIKKLYFWDKTYQMMLEKDSEYSTANTGSNAGKNNTQSSNSSKSLATVESVAALLTSDEDFKIHSDLTSNPNEWETGDEKTKIYFSSPVGAKFLENLNYLLNYTLASANDNYQPCIFKLERAEKSMLPKQFSLKSIKKYFQKAGKEVKTPGEYQNEHFFIYSGSDDKNVFPIQKAPLDSTKIDLNGEIKADNANTIRGYQLMDISGLDYSMNLTDYRVVFYNYSNGQFMDEGQKHRAEEYKKFFNDTIRPNILTKNSSDRLPLTPFIKEGKNTKTVVSLRTDEMSRLADGRNRLLKYYLFSNLAISFDVEGSTHRQPGRFFGVSKQSENSEEYDNKLEGQYFLTNVVHHFNNAKNSYMTRIIGVKTHTYEENSSFVSSDVSIINPVQNKQTAPQDDQNRNDSSQPPIRNVSPSNESTNSSNGWKPWNPSSDPLEIDDSGNVNEVDPPSGDLFPDLNGIPEDTSEYIPPATFGPETDLPSTPGNSDGSIFDDLTPNLPEDVGPLT
jgi:hypothetical protein